MPSESIEQSIGYLTAQIAAIQENLCMVKTDIRRIFDRLDELAGKDLVSRKDCEENRKEMRQEMQNMAGVSPWLAYLVFPVFVGVMVFCLTKWLG